MTTFKSASSVFLRLSPSPFGNNTINYRFYGDNGFEYLECLSLAPNCTTPLVSFQVSPQTAVTSTISTKITPFSEYDIFYAFEFD